MEKRLPFIAAIASGIITWVASLLFFHQYLLLVTIILMISVSVLRLNFWGLTGSFLIGLAFELYRLQDHETFQIVVSLLIFGSTIQIIGFIVPTIIPGPSIKFSSFGQNLVFAIFGLTILYLFRFWKCQPLIVADSVVQAMQQADACGLRFVMEPIYAIPESEFLTRIVQLDLPTIDAVARSISRVLLLSPLPWAAFFAAMSQVVLNRPSAPRLLAQSFKGCLGIIVGSAILGAILFLPLTFILSRLASSTLLEELRFILEFTITNLIIAFGAAWGARWGESRTS